MKYSEIEVGQKVEWIRLITNGSVELFKTLSGDCNSIHQSVNGPVYGMLIMAYISTLIGTQLPGDGALWMRGEFVFMQPIHLGDEIKIVATVIANDEMLNAIKLHIDVYNQKNEVCVMTSNWVKVPK